MMNEKVTFQTPPAGKDAAGQVIGGWTSMPLVWADARFPTGAEVVRNGLSVTTKRGSFRVRARADIDATMRLVHKGETYNVQAVLPDAKDRRFMFVVCEAAR